MPHRPFRKGLLLAGCIAAVALVAAFPAARAQTTEETRALARDIFKQLIEINTTHSVGNTTTAADAMAERLTAAGYEEKDVLVVGENSRSGNLVARIRGTGEKKPLLFLAHLDVVEAKREDWSSNPFVFLEKDGNFYGRGTSDIKDGDAILVTTLIRLKKEGFQPDRDIIVALTAGEESGAPNGVLWLLKNQRGLIDAEYCVNTDAGFEKRGKTRWAATIEAAEKRAVTFLIEARDAGGHSSRPRPGNPIYQIAEALVRISGFSFPVKLNETTRAFFERRAAMETGQTAADMKALEREPPDAEAVRRLSADPAFNALLHTTCVATQIEGGHAMNALPQAAHAFVNCRILPGVSVQEVQDTLARVIADPKINLSVLGIREGETPPASALRPDLMGAVEKVSAQMWPGVVVIPSMQTGATDGFYLRQAGIPTYGVGGVFFDESNNTAHGRDEYVGVEDFYQGVEFMYRLVKALTTPAH
jgi:acetylornithine deacetylase/succinyl-diaminopimelate desuccinylase-like protein